MDHTIFTRRDMDLFIEKKISLRDALCGFKFSFEHLDGRKMCLTVSPGEVIAPGTVRGIDGEGMCNYRHNDLHGNLYFEFTVEFPENNFLDEKDLEVKRGVVSSFEGFVCMFVCMYVCLVSS